MLETGEGGDGLRHDAPNVATPSIAIFTTFNNNNNVVTTFTRLEHNGRIG